jgi:hypothetical protein
MCAAICQRCRHFNPEDVPLPVHLHRLIVTARRRYPRVRWPLRLAVHCHPRHTWRCSGDTRQPRVCLCVCARVRVAGQARASGPRRAPGEASGCAAARRVRRRGRRGQREPLQHARAVLCAVAEHAGVQGRGAGAPTQRRRVSMDVRRNRATLPRLTRGFGCGCTALCVCVCRCRCRHHPRSCC